MKAILSYLEYYYNLRNYIKHINPNISDLVLEDTINNGIISPLFKMILANPDNETNEDYYQEAINRLTNVNQCNEESFSIIDNLFNLFIDLVESNIPDYNSLFRIYEIKFSILNNNKIVIVEINNVSDNRHESNHTTND